MILCREEHAKAIDKAIFPGQQGGPLMHTIAAKAVAMRIAASEQFRARQRQTIANAQALRRGPAKRTASRSSPAAPTSTSSSST